MFVQEISWAPKYRVLFRLVMVLALAVQGLALLAVGLALLAVGPGPKWLPFVFTAVTTALVLVILQVFMNLKVVVDERYLVVGFGPFKDKHPLHDVLGCKPVSYTFRDFGGWGIRMRWGKRMYNVPGDGGRAVEVELASGKKLYFSSADPDAACRAIELARAHA